MTMAVFTLETDNSSSKSVKFDRKNRCMDKVRWIVYPNLRPFHFQIKKYYLSDANYQTDNLSLVWIRPLCCIRKIACCTSCIRHQRYSALFFYLACSGVYWKCYVVCCLLCHCAYLITGLDHFKWMDHRKLNRCPDDRTLQKNRTHNVSYQVR